MIRTIFLRILLPSIAYLAISIAILVLIPPQQIAIGQAVSVALLAALYGWWGVLLARGILHRYGRLAVPYLISNLSVVCFWLGIGVSVGVLFSPILEEAAALFPLLATIAGAIFFLIALVTFPFTVRRKELHGFFWRQLLSTSWIWSRPKDKRGLRSVPAQSPVSAESVSKASRSSNGPGGKAIQDDSIFARVVLERQKRSIDGISIPPRESPSQATSLLIESADEPQEQASRIPGSVAIQFETSQSSFVESARRFVNRTERSATPVPFMHYFPTYAAMSKSQQKWYFYWRTQTRKGEVVPTDLSYLFIHVYELLNLIGAKSAEDAYNQLVQFWNSYRVLQPKLDNYLVDWLADFAVVHHLPVDPIEIYGLAYSVGAVPHRDEELLLESWAKSGGNFESLPAELLYRVADYNPKNNKFYQLYHDELQLDEAYRRGLQAVNNYQRDATGTSLTDPILRKPGRPVRRHPFSGAIHAYMGPEITVMTVHPWMSDEVFSNGLRQVIRATENFFRAEQKYRLLSLNDISVDWINAIKATFSKPVKRPKLQINMDHVVALQRESEATRERLIVEESEVLPYDQKEDSSISHIEISEKVQDPGSIPDSSQPSPEQTSDQESIQNLVTIQGKEARSILQLLVNNQWAVADTLMASVSENGFVSVLIDRLNEQALGLLGENLVVQADGVWTVPEELRDATKLAIRFSDNGQRPDKPIDELSMDPDPGLVNAASDQNATDDWLELADQLTSIQWQALHIIAGKSDVDDALEKVSRSANITTNLLLDDINEIALESIGDNIIDSSGVTPQIIEEYEEDVNDMISWAGQQELTEA